MESQRKGRYKRPRKQTSLQLYIQRFMASHPSVVLPTTQNSTLRSVSKQETVPPKPQYRHPFFATSSKNDCAITCCQHDICCHHPTHPPSTLIPRPSPFNPHIPIPRPSIVAWSLPTFSLDNREASCSGALPDDCKFKRWLRDGKGGNIYIPQSMALRT